MPQYYKLRYERAPGKAVHVPTPFGAAAGARIVDRVSKRYKPAPIFFHIGARGGHVAALRAHLGSHFFSRFDLANFYGNVTRSKVARALKNLGFGQDAFAWAFESVVVEGGKKILPQGFHQSPLLATLVLEQSELGITLSDLAKSGLRVTVYMDDIIVSGETEEAVAAASDRVQAAAAAANFPVSQSKLALTKSSLEAFNCDLVHGRMQIGKDRLDRFADQWLAGNGYVQAGITRYVTSVNEGDLDRLMSITNVAG